MGSLHDGVRRQTLVYWPVQIDRRLELLLALIDEQGGQASRAQLLAALVATAPLDGAALSRVVVSYIAQDEERFASENAQHRAPRETRRPGPRGRRKRSA